MMALDMKIIAIETSCDETGVAVLEISGGFKAPRIKILSNIVASQVKIHAPFGGVVPNLAKREHQKNLPLIFKKALKEARLSLKNPRIDLIAVTSGPGLEPALWVGINFAQELAKKYNKPLLGINHLEGHIFSIFLEKNRKSTKHEARSTKRDFGFRISNFEFPAIALLVSGGHTELVLSKKPLEYKVIGQTLDDAAGEAFDKVARLLGLGYPGGPAIGVMAEKKLKLKHDIKSATAQFISSNDKVKLPRPMINSKDYNFSFSGLKTAVLYKLKELEQKMRTSSHDREYLVSAMVKEFQQAVIDVLISKTMRVAKEYKAKTVILGGGVAANKELRKQLQQKMPFNCDSRYVINLLMPEMEFTGDNAAMIALAAYFRWLKNKKPRRGGALKADGNLKLT